MPSGHTSMVPKPDFPVYFLGDKATFRYFTTFIPNPKATYAYLEFPFNSDKIKGLIKNEKDRKDKEAKKQKVRQIDLFKD
jgi:hypothetical protein